MYNVRTMSTFSSVPSTGRSLRSDEILRKMLNIRFRRFSPKQQRNILDKRYILNFIFLGIFASEIFSNIFFPRNSEHSEHFFRIQNILRKKTFLLSKNTSRNFLNQTNPVNYEEKYTFSEYSNILRQ